MILGASIFYMHKLSPFIEASFSELVELPPSCNSTCMWCLKSDMQTWNLSDLDPKIVKGQISNPDLESLSTLSNTFLVG